MSPRMRRLINWAGVVVAVGGFFLARWEIRHMSQFVNYQRVGMMLPLVYGVTMMHVDTFANWSTATSYARIRATGIVIVAVILTLGTFAWLSEAPDAKATP